MMKSIDFALVEGTRPPLYTAMKYWGKKPHNIWQEYIKTYTPEKGLYLDPFTGSAMSAFEAVKAGRKALAFDLNPLTSFLIKTYCQPFNKQKFKAMAEKVISSISSDPIYLKYFSTQCKNCQKPAIAQNFKWEDHTLYEIGVQCSDCDTLWTKQPIDSDFKTAQKMQSMEIPYYYPKDSFPSSPSFSANFSSRVGGPYFYNLWTKRNLYIISKIFHEIQKVESEDIKNQLLLGFIKTLHLCSKMCVPRRASANRPFSTSWGRSAYISANRQMEMNPLLVFKTSCFGKQSVESALCSLKRYLGKTPKALYVDKSNKSHRNKNFDIKYGIVDINTILNFVDEGSIDFILTDPPYGGLVQYLDLSLIWLVWLKKIDNRYTPNLQSEITIKDKKNMEDYNLKFQKAMKNLYKVLKPEGKAVFTFHNKDIKIWNAFLKAIRLAGFKIEKVIHQQNKRTGESNVANPYGTSGTDFYVRCKKSPFMTIKNHSSEEKEFIHKVVETAISLIAQRNEPTPYQILFNGILSEISSAGFDIEDFDLNIKNILEQKIGSVFKITSKKDNGAGKYWWFKNPSDYIKYPDRDLNDRLEWTISSMLRNKQSVAFDDVLAKIFIKYPNGLTPEVKSIGTVLKKYGRKSGALWHYKGVEAEKVFTDHTKMLVFLSQIGKKMGLKVYIGKAEQSDKYENKKLLEYADLTNLSLLNLEKRKKERVEMIDMLWIKNKRIEYAIEVENSTNFTSGLQRASNLGYDTKKIMVLPEERKNEFLSIKDPLFLETFKKYNWQYLFYGEVSVLKSSRNINADLLNQFLNRGHIDYEQNICKKSAE